jgi:hypothetical protein
MARTPDTEGADQLSVENVVGFSHIYLKKKE